MFDDIEYNETHTDDGEPIFPAIERLSIIAESGPHIVHEDGQLPVLVCQKCTHRWNKRYDDLPAVCPKCKSKHWDRPKLAGRGRPRRVPVDGQ